MFELLLLIGFLYAGFFPPTPASNRYQTTSHALNDRHAPNARGSDESRVAMKKLAHKNKNC